MEAFIRLREVALAISSLLSNVSAICVLIAREEYPVFQPQSASQRCFSLSWQALLGFFPANILKSSCTPTSAVILLWLDVTVFSEHEASGISIGVQFKLMCDTRLTDVIFLSLGPSRISPPQDVRSPPVFLPRLLSFVLLLKGFGEIVCAAESVFYTGCLKLSRTPPCPSPLAKKGFPNPFTSVLSSVTLAWVAHRLIMFLSCRGIHFTQLYLISKACRRPRL